MASKPRRAYLACMGDATNPETWGSIPYHILMYGRAAGFLNDGLRLEPHAR